MITLYSRSDVAAGFLGTNMRFNGDTAANYDYQMLQGAAAAATAAETFANTSLQVGIIPGNTAAANLFGTQEVFIPHYAGSTNNKQFVAISAAKIGVATTNMEVNIFGGSWRSNAAINQVTMIPGGGNFVAGTRLTIHAMGA